jgi:hypothetical protein
MNSELPQAEVITVEYLITREFTNSTDFSLHIEREAIRRKIGFMESLMEYCDEKGIEPIAVASMISSSLKEKIRAEAEEMNLLKKSPKLPL